MNEDGDQVNSPETSAGRITVRTGQEVPHEGYWFEPNTNWVRYFEQGQKAPEGTWTFVTSAFNLPRTELRAMVVQYGLFVGDICDIRFE